MHLLETVFVASASDVSISELSSTKRAAAAFPMFVTRLKIMI